MEPDFSGYATRVGIKCSDGRTILRDAFKDCDGMEVPLVWQHGHGEATNVLGHALLENRADGVYAYAFCNETPTGKHAKAMVEHGDIKSFSIYANNLKESRKNVSHGVIREVSLVLAGANPGALIDFVNIRHSDGAIEELDDEAIIYTDSKIDKVDNDMADSKNKQFVNDERPISQQTPPRQAVTPETAGTYDPNVADADDDDEELSHADASGRTVKDIYDTFNSEQLDVLHYLIGTALEEAGANVQHSDFSEDEMTHNVFESQSGSSRPQLHLSHDDVQGIVKDAVRGGSLKAAVEDFAIAHGIENIDILFPDAKALADRPEFIARRMEWVDKVLSGTKHSPFARIKTLTADITQDEARAKGYIKGSYKKEEFFSVAKRETGPTTIYKKQQLDRDDVIDITDFDIVAWLKAEMRVMLDEEIARAILVGDGREVDDEDKIREDCIRPIAKEHELYATTITVNIDDANSDSTELADAIIRSRASYRGSGMPTMFVSETHLTNMLLVRDKMGRRLYRTDAELASELRVSEIVPVEILSEDDPTLIAIIVNLSDYNVGTNRGGDVTMFDDFDIDYNRQKYLIETRLSGALTKYKSAIVVRKTDAATDILATPVAPAYNDETHVITIPTVTGVFYSINGEPVANGSTHTVPAGETAVVTAAPSDVNYFFATTDQTSWSFRG